MATHGAETDRLAAALDPAITWLQHAALPLWAGAGFDGRRGLYEERLDFDGRPIGMKAFRLMAQCRQIATYARATLEGRIADRGELTTEAFRKVVAIYRPREAAGWIFSATADGAEADGTRDLYAHAFVLFAIAWLVRIDDDPALVRLADETIADIDRIFGPVGPGHLSRAPGDASIREQNPHMHLIEAYIALAEATQAERYLARAGDIVDLFHARLHQPASGAVLEIFNADLSPSKPAGQNPVEPGHQFEWAWLLGRHERLSGRASSDSRRALLRHATGFGLDAATGLVFDEVREDGAPISRATRVWPQTEAVRALAAEARGGDPDAAGRAASILASCMARHCLAELRGGWRDRLDVDGRVSVDHMPASTLYHVAGALLDVFATVGRDAGHSVPPSAREEAIEARRSGGRPQESTLDGRRDDHQA